LDAAAAQAQRKLADSAGIKPQPAEKVKAALEAGGEPVRAAELRALLRDVVAELILKYSPQEKHLAEAWRVPVLQRPEKTDGANATSQP